MFIRLAVIVVVCFGLSGLLTNLRLPTFESFFLDRKQMIASFLGAKPSFNDIQILDVTALKTETAEGLKIPASKLLDVIETISQTPFKAMILSVSPEEVQFDISEQELSKRLSNISKLYLFSNSTIFKNTTFDFHKRFERYPEPLFLHLTYDAKIDLVSRRIITYFDLEYKNANPDFAVIDRMFGRAQSPEKFHFDFPYQGTSQVFMKVWNPGNFSELAIDPGGVSAEKLEQIKDKVVILGTSGIYSVNSTPRIASSAEEYVPVSHLLATYLTNLRSGEYVKTPPPKANWLWMGIALFCLLSSLTLFPVRAAFAASTFIIFAYVILGLMVFRTASLNLDTGKVLLLGFVGQYAILSTRFFRMVRRLDKENFQREKQATEERLRSRILVRAATMESTMRTLGKMAHDIRSPLMALHVAHSLLKNQVNPELRDLISNSISRINGIAEDLLKKYKSKSGDAKDTETFLGPVVNELIDSYIHVHPQAKFTVNVPSEIEVNWGAASIQRSFSNLLNNSLEACYANNIKPEIEILAAKVDAKIRIDFKDNGPGVSEKNIPKLFLEGSTFGKEQGTGLGLFQVKKDLEFFGGTITYQKQQGACFTILIPAARDPVKFMISSAVILVQNTENNGELKRKLEASGADVKYFNDVSKASDFIKKEKFIEPITVISDLMFSTAEETGFDVLDACDNKPIFKMVLCTSLVDSAEIQDLANKKGASLVSSAFMETVVISLRK
ncbi:ATP-binding protein [Bdellovibrio reynosensis]|uniref:histidine kinase n=1 Tax=Bdellovibrio reynosensis TaxID=2835041 RepID=A0ABY4C7E3_9BACT|nr:ATP-binding protein [Bdellovibrio reynosensis]UOF00907.1 ATP-binding protein [Bdellovibrio reynosensis]